MERKEFKVAVVGATGAVGNLMVRVLEERSFPVSELTLLASARSVGRKMVFRGKEIPVRELTEDSFAGIQVAKNPHAFMAPKRCFFPRIEAI